MPLPADPDPSLADDLLALFRAGADRALGEDRFGALALRVFRRQLALNPVYAAFARNRGASPAEVEDWREIPPVPASAFRVLPLLSGDPEGVEVSFRTSGTSRGGGTRGTHRILEPALYHASLKASFTAHLLPDGARLPLFSLIPPPERVPDSSLSHMMGVVARELSAPGGGWFVEGDGRLRDGALREALAGAARTGNPVLLAGTAFALVHWMDAAARDGWTVRLPEGSRVMETGGYKGRSRTLPRGEFYAALSRLLGLPPERIVNEYGMTELLSQFYEPVLREGGPAEPDRRRHLPPPWVRTRVLDPESLRELPPGRVGLLCHLDLANLGSVAAVLTEDLGVAVEDGFRVLGRVPGAEPRGCSLAMDDLMAAASTGAGGV